MAGRTGRAGTALQWGIYGVCRGCVGGVQVVCRGAKSVIFDRVATPATPLRPPCDPYIACGGIDRMRTHARRAKRDNEGRNLGRAFCAPPPCPSCPACLLDVRLRLPGGSLRSPWARRRRSKCAPLARPLCGGYCRRCAETRGGIERRSGRLQSAGWYTTWLQLYEAA